MMGEVPLSPTGLQSEIVNNSLGEGHSMTVPDSMKGRPPQSLPPRKPDTLPDSEKLTASEIARLLQIAKDDSAYLQKVYPGLKLARP